jgi:hypothetical protein
MIYDTLQYMDAVHYMCSDDRNTNHSHHRDIVHLEYSGKKKKGAGEIQESTLAGKKNVTVSKA